ncbi:MAG TPA: 2-hydroxychromene-2-carboxylate isomerase [Caulobacteraceae bacterium]|jgi:2-hydroxychromene-2-carboxylate isomerase|nr:2-hydroxychromene-2-carboxylate isomerase [Caulobacteraceae bacterium]
MTEVTFYFDFGSPNAYLAHKVIPDIEKRTGARFIYVPALLGGIFKATGNQSPAQAFAGIPSKLAYEAKETRRFVKRHGITEYAMNPHFPVNTLQIMRGVVAAQQLGVFEAYVDAVFRAMWVEALKMDDPAVIRQAFEDAGLPADRLIELMGDPGVKARLIENTEAAVAHGAFGSPSFLVAGELFFGKDRLRDIEEEVMAQPSA